ncbi:YkgJ family cysteine cluster protein [Pseudomonas sp. WHRI 8519]|uniref:YkgJ family cysteine cluster protein n=1 Tax=Pseudomonas sp. WHRI 8519 TaxID=3162567 RepID=UPI0032ED2A05
MDNRAIRFSCNSCGACCKGRLIPLTLEETKLWLKRGHEVAILLEAFDEFQWGSTRQELAHAKGRAVEVTSGGVPIYVIAVFAGNALTGCQNLDDKNRCGIYDDRPLVCRIYPAEVNPFITLTPASKVCPPEVWEGGEVLFNDNIIDPILTDQIERSRKADRGDAQAKIALCEILGLNVAAWKGNAFTIYMVDREQLLDAIVFYDIMKGSVVRTNWRVRTDTPSLRKKITKTGIVLDDHLEADYIFYPLEDI